MTQHRFRRQTSRKARHAAVRAGRSLGYEALEARELLTITVEFQTTLGNFQVELFDDIAPRTVANFLNYVTSDRLDNTFFHRSAPGFVVQGGGFGLNSDGTASSVVTDPAVQNEFNRSNLRGTIAMAKLGGNPNSATSQFFFNLANNASNLDNQNGGFTVFGQVVGNGMQVVDAIAAVPRFNVNAKLGGGAFTDTPLQNYTTGNPVTAANLIFIQNVSIVGNAAPIVIPFASTTVTVGEGKSLSPPQVQAKEFNAGQTLSYSLIDPPAGASINPATGQISWVPTAEQANQTFALRVRAADSTGLSDVESFNVRVNDAPALTPIGNRSVAEGSPITFQLSATDTDSAPASLTYALESGAPQGSTFDPATRIFSWTPSESQGPGNYTLTFRVTDDTGLTSTQSVNLNVTEVNQPPVLAPIGNKSVNRGQTLSFVVSATDPDLPANALSYSLDPGAPAGATFDPATRRFSWTPALNQLGTFGATIRVSDGAGGSDFETIALAVLRPNQPPTLEAIANQIVAEGDLLKLNLSAQDPDLPDEVLRFALLSGPQGAQLNDAGGFQFRPTEAQGPGVYPVSVQVIDSQGVSATRSFNVSVTEVPTPPQFAPLGPQTVAATRQLSVKAQGSDVDLPAQALVYSLGMGAPAGATINASTGEIAWTPGEDLVGQQVTFTVLVTDPTGRSATQSFTVAVTEAPKFDPAELLLGLANPADVLSAGASGLRVMNLATTVQTTFPFVSFGTAAQQLSQAINRNEASPRLTAGAPNFLDGPDTGVAHIHRPQQTTEEKGPGKDGKGQDKGKGPTQPTSARGNEQQTRLGIGTKTAADQQTEPSAAQADGEHRAQSKPASRLEEAVFAAWDEELAWTDRPVLTTAADTAQSAPAIAPLARPTGDATAPPATGSTSAGTTATGATAAGNAGTAGSSTVATSAKAGAESDKSRRATAAQPVVLAAGLLAPMLVAQLEEREKQARRTWRRRGR